MSQPTDDQVLAALEESMTDINEMPPSFLGMLYGNSGVGKTVLAFKIAQLITPPEKFILYVDTAQGWVSIKNHPELLQRTKIMKYKGISQLSAIGRLKDSPLMRDVGCIILDELNTMADMDLDTLTRTRAKSDKEKDPDAPTWPDRNAGDNRFKRTLYEVIGTGCHIIAVAHEREAKNKQKLSITAPSFADALREKVKQPLHLVGHVAATLIEGQESDTGAVYRRYVQCHPTRLVDAKSRIGGLDIQVSFKRLCERIPEWLDTGGQEVEESKPVILESEKDSQIEANVGVTVED